MCGIFCALSHKHHVQPSTGLRRRLEARGPDSSCSLQLEAETPSGNVYLTLFSTVLSLRGSTIITQPLQNDRHVLCWNGEAWSIDSRRTTGNDTEAVYKLLAANLNLENLDGSLEASTHVIAHALSRIAGPYAFVLYDRKRDHLFLGRDFLGRRSLMTCVSNTGDLSISSVSDPDSTDVWQELGTDGIYSVDLRRYPYGSAEGDYLEGFAAYSYSGIPTTNIPESGESVIPRLTLNKVIPTTVTALNASSLSITCLETLLEESLSLRILGIHEPLPVNNAGAFRLSKLAILFSGGLDCTVLARMSHDILDLDEPIDLINVAFENPRIHKNRDRQESAKSAYELCPDRMTGRSSYSELLRICPGREWRFVTVDIQYSETQEHKQQVISLMRPHNTEMDLSIALALYLAARGSGEITVAATGTQVSYTSSARVMLSGLGADELFGGYTRHATAHRRGGLPALLDELELDVSRLGKRNLGRDDRVISHWGREVRFPYLDERLLSWALAAPVTNKCGFAEPGADELPTKDGKQDIAVLEAGKKVLRCLAWKLGMEGVAREKKRAIQFGARTAKMDARKTKGTELLS